MRKFNDDHTNMHDNEGSSDFLSLLKTWLKILLKKDLETRNFRFSSLYNELPQELFPSHRNHYEKNQICRRLFVSV